MNESEQYKLDGDCNKCRRADYCSKPCGAKKKADRIALNNAKQTIMRAVCGSTIADGASKYLEDGGKY